MWVVLCVATCTRTTPLLCRCASNQSCVCLSSWYACGFRLCLRAGIRVSDLGSCLPLLARHMTARHHTCLKIVCLSSDTPRITVGAWLQDEAGRLDESGQGSDQGSDQSDADRATICGLAAAAAQCKDQLPDELVPSAVVQAEPVSGPAPCKPTFKPGPVPCGQQQGLGGEGSMVRPADQPLPGTAPTSCSDLASTSMAAEASAELESFRRHASDLAAAAIKLAAEVCASWCLLHLCECLCPPTMRAFCPISAPLNVAASSLHAAGAYLGQTLDTSCVFQLIASRGCAYAWAPHDNIKTAEDCVKALQLMQSTACAPLTCTGEGRK